MFHKSNYFLRNSNHSAQFALSNGDLPTKSKSDPLRRSTLQKSKSDPIVGSLEPDWFRA